MPSTFAKASIFALLAASAGPGCTAATRIEDGFEVYADIKPEGRYSYALPDDAPEDLKRLLTLALGHWNDALGEDMLFVAPKLETASVKVLYTRSARLSAKPAHVQLLGCQKRFDRLANCTINFEVPETLKDDLQNVVFLFRQGPLDPALYETNEYADVTDYLRDKLILMSLVHEIGHTLGLAHARDDSCIMAAAPAGNLKFCPSEIRAVKRRLLGAAH